MTLENIAAKIRELSGDTPGTNVATTSGRWTVTLTVEKHDQWSCLLTGIQGQHESPATFDWKTWANGVADRVRSLGDPLKLLEVDGHQGASLLRSEKPHVQGKISSYHELTGRNDGSFQLRRFQGSLDASRQREKVAFAITYESLTRLVQELTEG